MIHADPASGRVASEYYHYDPYGVVDFRANAPGNHNRPVTQIHGTPGVGQVGYSFQEMASSRGTIFIYQLVTDTTMGMITI